MFISIHIRVFYKFLYYYYYFSIVFVSCFLSCSSFILLLYDAHVQKPSSFHFSSIHTQMMLFVNSLLSLLWKITEETRHKHTKRLFINNIQTAFAITRMLYCFNGMALKNPPNPYTHSHV